jgi:hypothetical protein
LFFNNNRAAGLPRPAPKSRTGSRFVYESEQERNGIGRKEIAKQEARKIPKIPALGNHHEFYEVDILLFCLYNLPFLYLIAMCE